MMTKEQMQIWVGLNCKFAICEKVSDAIIQSLVDIKVASITKDDLVKIIVMAMPGLSQAPFSGQPQVDQESLNRAKQELELIVQDMTGPITITDLKLNLGKILNRLNLPLNVNSNEYKSVIKQVIDNSLAKGKQVVSPETQSAQNILEKQKTKAPAFKPFRPKGLPMGSQPSGKLPARAPARKTTPV